LLLSCALAGAPARRLLSGDELVLPCFESLRASIETFGATIELRELFGVQPLPRLELHEQDGRAGEAARSSTDRGNVGGAASVRSGMVRTVLTFVLLPLACMAPAEAELLEMRERDEALGSVPIIPDGERTQERAPIVETAEAIEELEEPSASSWPARGQPRIVVGPWRGRHADDEDLDGSALCPFEVTTRGFPAISLDGRTVVGAIRGAWSASDGEDEVMVVEWHDADRDEVTESATVFDGEADQPSFEDTAARCKPMWRAAKQRAADINAKLETERWRTLVDVGVHARHGVLPWEDEGEEPPAPLPASERPVELVHVGKQAALRIRGVRVLHRADVDWLGTESWPCQLSPVVYTVLGDRETGTLAVFLDHQSGGCLCYAELELHTLRVPEAIFTEAARRPQPQYVPDQVLSSAH
jgi:hypothetical protein